MALLTVPTHLPNTDNFIPQVLGIWELIAKQRQQQAENQRLWAAQNEASTQAMLSNQRLEHQFAFQRQRAAMEDARYREEHAPISFAPESRTPAESAASLPISSAVASDSASPPDSSPLMGSPDFAHSVATATNAAAPSFGLQLPNPTGDTEPILGAPQMPPADLLSDPAFDPYHARTRNPVRIPSLDGGVDSSGSPQTFVNPDLLAGSPMLESANATGGGGWAQPEAPVDSTPGIVDSRTINWIKQQEGFKARAYPDGRQTSIGYGTRAQSANEQIDPGEAHVRLVKELTASAASIDDAAAKVGLPLAPPQRAALISYDYNTGRGADALLKSGGDPNAVAEAIRNGPKTQNGSVLAGLVKRRNDEYTVFKAGAMPSDASSPLFPNAPALPTNDRTPAQSVVASLSEMQRAGIPINRANLPHYVSVAQQMGKPDHIDPNSEAGVAARIKVGTTLANARATRTNNGDELTWVGDTAFTKNHKAYRYDDSGELNPVTGKDAYGAPEEQIDKAGLKLVGTPGMENIVTNKEGTLLQQASFDSKGKLSLKPYSSGKLEHIGDTIVRVMPDNKVIQVAKVDKVLPVDSPKLLEAMKAHADAADKLILATNATGDFFHASNVVDANKKLDQTSSDLEQFIIRYPFLDATVGKALTKRTAGQPGPEKGAGGADPTQDPEAFKAAYAAAQPGEALTFQGKTYRKPGP